MFFMDFIYDMLCEYDCDYILFKVVWVDVECELFDLWWFVNLFICYVDLVILVNFEKLLFMVILIVLDVCSE